MLAFHLTNDPYFVPSNDRHGRDIIGQERSIPTDIQDETWDGVVYASEPVKLFAVTDHDDLNEVSAGWAPHREYVAILDLSECDQNHFCQGRWLKSEVLLFDVSRVKVVDVRPIKMCEVCNENHAVTTGRRYIESFDWEKEEWVKEYGDVEQLICQYCTRDHENLHGIVFDGADQLFGRN